jgi:tRNA U55 pseudouridine synthase TruB
MHSALKHAGKPLYEYARAGETIERALRHVRIHEIELLDVALPEFSMRVRCSKGTYIRTLAEDIGNALGCGAHLSALRRTRSGPLVLESTCTLEHIAAWKKSRVARCCIPRMCFCRTCRPAESATRLRAGSPTASLSLATRLNRRTERCPKDR